MNIESKWIYFNQIEYVFENIGGKVAAILYRPKCVNT